MHADALSAFEFWLRNGGQICIMMSSIMVIAAL